MKPADKPVLCVVSSHPIKGASGVPTGFFLVELTHSLKVLEDAGLQTTIASIREGQPPVDGFDLSDPVNALNPASGHGIDVALLNALRQTV